MTSRPRRGALLAGAWAWVVAAVVYITCEVVTGLAWNGHYDWMENSISDLGWTEPGWVEYPFQPLWADSPLARLFNGGSIVAGILMVFGAWQLRSLWEPGRSRRLGRWITWSWIVMGVFTVVTALVPGNYSLFWHSVLAQPIFFAAPAVCVFSAVQIQPARHHLAVVGAVLGAIALVGTAGLLVQLLVRVPFGLLERMALDGVFLWMLVAGTTVVARPDHPGTDPRPGAERAVAAR